MTVIFGRNRHIAIPAMTGVRVHSHGGTGSAWTGSSAWWEVSGKTCYCAYEAKNAPSLAASYTDISGNGRDAGVGAAPDWDATNGWKFNGSSHYLTTTFVPDTDQTTTMLIQFSNHDGADYKILAGAWTGAGVIGRYWLSPDWASGKANYANNSEAQIAPALTAGNMGVAGTDAYKDGSDVGNIPTFKTSMTYPVWICVVNDNGSASRFAAAYVQAFVVYTDVLSSAEVATVAAAMAAL